jgi:hypothetical protein
MMMMCVRVRVLTFKENTSEGLAATFPVMARDIRC